MSTIIAEKKSEETCDGAGHEGAAAAGLGITDDAADHEKNSVHIKSEAGQGGHGPIENQVARMTRLDSLMLAGNGFAFARRYGNDTRFYGI
jgi:hypothetical protein